jgi:hypothetical protein
VNSFSRCVYWGLKVSVFGIKYWFCLCVYFWELFFRMFDSGHGFSSMSLAM